MLPCWWVVVGANLSAFRLVEKLGSRKVGELAGRGGGVVGVSLGGRRPGNGGCIGGFSRVTGTGECSPAAGWWWFTGGAREKEGAASARGVVNKRVWGGLAALGGGTPLLLGGGLPGGKGEGGVKR